MLSCQQATRLLSEAQDRELGTIERMSLKMHITMCAACRNFAGHMHSLRHFARAYARGDQKESDDK